jgi:hypothetical protein
MARLVLVASRNKQELPFDWKDLEALSLRLAPDNITLAAPRIIDGGGVLTAILNPPKRLSVRGCSVCAGGLFDEDENWWKPGFAIPDGSYALFRTDDQTIELVTDIVASRTFWYARTEDLFIASTSQRAIICLLQSFEPNEATVPWMLSSGTLGPGYSWDRRIKCLPGDSRLVLDRESWKVEIVRKPVEYRPLNLPEEEHEQRLLTAMQDTFKHIEANSGRWILPLSGGYDSRAILLMLKNRVGLKTVTWGMKSALNRRKSDAWVARELASEVGVEHEYLETDLADEPVDRILDRFLLAGEGRVDNLSGYTDGFAIWKRLYERGCEAILRGDEAFGCHAVENDQQVYKNMSLVVLDDFQSDTNVDFKCFGNGQRRPEAFVRRGNESREQWRDRVYVEFEVPYIFAALSDLKLSYVEVIQPLLSRRIVEQVRTLPDAFRTDKRLFKKVVKKMSPSVPFAKDVAIASRANILREEKVIQTICGRLERFDNQPEYLRPLSRLCLDLLDTAGKRKNTEQRSRINQKIHRWVRKVSGRGQNKPLEMDPYSLAFRVFILARMNEILKADANLLRSS